MLRLGQMATISGVGLVTPLGLDARSTFAALLDSSYITGSGRIEAIRTQAAVPRVSTLAMAAALEAVTHAGWQAGTLADAATALVVGTSKGPVDAWVNALSHMSKSRNSAAGHVESGLARVADDVASGLGLGCGPRLTSSAACASGLHALARAVLLIQAGECRRALVVAAESSLHALFQASFTRLGVLAPEEYGCRPFDRDRRGFVMSEAAAAVCLEREPTGATMARVSGFALGTDAGHLTAGDPDGRTMRQLLRRVLGDGPVDLVHAHGTGTSLNDPIELSAIDDTLSTGGANLYSHKGGLGHSLGASGLVSVVLSCLMHEQAVVLPNVQTSRPLQAKHVEIAQRAVQRPVERSLVAAAGFGGAAGVLGLISP